MDQQSESVVGTALHFWAKRGKRSTVKISGNSMWPLFKDGSTVVVEHGSAGLRFGEIVLFQRGEILIAHRIVRISRRSGRRFFITKGDRSLRYDRQRLEEDHILGRVIGIEKGEAFQSLHTKYWSVIGCILALCSLCIGFIVHLRCKAEAKAKAKEKEKNRLL